MTGSDSKTYRFYGWKTADIKDEKGLTPLDYYDLLKDIWAADTCAPRLRAGWNHENRTLGQCSITAFLLQDIFGGKVYGIKRGDGNFHCFNDVNGCVFDLTSEQFGDEKLNYSDCQEQFREDHFQKEEKRRRYELLKERLAKAQNGSFIAPISPKHPQKESINYHWTDGNNEDFRRFYIKTEEYYSRIAGGISNRSGFVPYNLSESIADVLIAYSNGLAIGCAGLKAYSDTDVEIKRVWVEPD